MSSYIEVLRPATDWQKAVMERAKELAFEFSNNPRYAGNELLLALLWQPETVTAEAMIAKENDDFVDLLQERLCIRYYFYGGICYEYVIDAKEVIYMRGGGWTDVITKPFRGTHKTFFVMQQKGILSALIEESIPALYRKEWEAVECKSYINSILFIAEKLDAYFEAHKDHYFVLV